MQDLSGVAWSMNGGPFGMKSDPLVQRALTRSEAQSALPDSSAEDEGELTDTEAVPDDEDAPADKEVQ